MFTVVEVTPLYLTAFLVLVGGEMGIFCYPPSQNLFVFFAAGFVLAFFYYVIKHCDSWRNFHYTTNRTAAWQTVTSNLGPNRIGEC